MQTAIEIDIEGCYRYYIVVLVSKYDFQLSYNFQLATNYYNID